ncbi:molybdenum cofactor guanylyltransferase [Paenibacillus nanensis]|uniref:Molybdenum cofactor guanylyltransferase n=1 Tax=Paenibacillus nanensis TaxID=393251 RepID=A0A3A1UVY7_9BACL|nr:molybdenum cofactor guanylyltransferase [Paenibacillus nanensis]RIX50483.1 molybdenum cofactor guanylyltransferase [Paenibacillus nanensis]
MLSGVILAGGAHRGMKGDNRAFLVVDGQTLIERQIREMKTCCSEITIVTNEPQLFLKTVDRDIRIITDYYAGKGLLSGMHAGLALAKNRHVWLLGCHLPSPSAQAAKLQLSYMQEGTDAVLPFIKETVYPLHGIYDRSNAERIGRLLDGGITDVSLFLRQINRTQLAESHFEEQGINREFVRSIHTQGDFRNSATL